MLLGKLIDELSASTDPASPAAELASIQAALVLIRCAVNADEAVLVLHPDGPTKVTSFVGHASSNPAPLRGQQIRSVTSLSFVLESFKSDQVSVCTKQVRDPFSPSACALRIHHLVWAPVLDLQRTGVPTPRCGVLIADRRQPHDAFDAAAQQTIGSLSLELAALLKLLADRRIRMEPTDQQKVEVLQQGLVKHQGKKLKQTADSLGISEKAARQLLAEAGLSTWQRNLQARWTLTESRFVEQLQRTGDLCEVGKHFGKRYEQIEDHLRYRAKKRGSKTNLREYVEALGYNWQTVRGPEFARTRSQPIKRRKRRNGL